MENFLKAVLICVVLLGFVSAALNDPNFANQFRLRSVLDSLGFYSGLSQKEKFVQKTKVDTVTAMNNYRQILKDQKQMMEDLKSRNDTLLEDLHRRMEGSHSELPAGEDPFDRLQETVEQTKVKNEQLIENLKDRLTDFENRQDLALDPQEIARQQGELMARLNQNMESLLFNVNDKLNALRETQAMYKDSAGLLDRQREIITESRRKNEQMMRDLREKIQQERQKILDNPASNTTTENYRQTLATQKQTMEDLKSRTKMFLEDLYRRAEGSTVNRTSVRQSYERIHEAFEQTNQNTDQLIENLKNQLAAYEDRKNTGVDPQELNRQHGELAARLNEKMDSLMANLKDRAAALKETSAMYLNSAGLLARQKEIIAETKIKNEQMTQDMRDKIERERQRMQDLLATLRDRQRDLTERSDAARQQLAESAECQRDQQQQMKERMEQQKMMLEQRQQDLRNR